MSRLLRLHAAASVIRFTRGTARRPIGFRAVHDLAVIVTSLNEAHWLRPCLRSVFERAGDLDLQVLVVDIDSTDDTRALVEREFGPAETVVCTNRGFSHANNRGYLRADARYVLFLNPDTEIVGGTLASLVTFMDTQRTIGIVGCRQLTPDGAIHPTMRRFMSARRTFAEALGSERFARTAGQRVLDLPLYDRRTPCDWVMGSFMLARREALLSAGCLDERFFLYSEEEDLCLRLRRAGWDVWHVPDVTIVHHVGKSGVVPRLESQRAFARLQYASKNLTRTGRLGVRVALGVGYALRAVRASFTGDAAATSAARRGLSVALGKERAPFIEPPPTALPPGEAHDPDQ